MKPRQTDARLMFMLAVVDSLLITGAYAFACWLRFSSGWLGAFVEGADSWKYYWYAAPLVLLIFLLVFKYAGLYRMRRGSAYSGELRTLFFSTFVSLLLFAGGAFFYREFDYSIKVFLLTAILVFVNVLGWRFIFRLILLRLRRKGLGVARTLIVGSGQTACMLAARLNYHRGVGYRLLGFMDNVRPASVKRIENKMGVKLFGEITDLKRVIDREKIECVVVALPSGKRKLLQEFLLEFDYPEVDLRVVSDLFGMIMSPVAADSIQGIPIFAFKDIPLDNSMNRFLKRLFDLFLVIPGLFILAPLMVLIALGVKLSSPGPVFFRQERVGLNNVSFQMLKFRSMRADAEEKTGPVWAQKDDPRKTALGSFLRRTSLDELPQLFNVLSEK